MLAVGRKTQSRSQSSISHANAGDAGQFDSSSSSSRKTRGLCRLSFYESPPSADVDIETFETYGIARLQVLRRIDVLQARGVKGDKFDKEINKADLEQLFNGNNNGSNSKDHISHYILRMAYCQTEELRRWFLTNESILFKIRFKTSKASDVDNFLRERKLLLKYPPISYEEKMRLKPKLIGLDDGSASTEFNYNNSDYYKVPFMDVLQLVSRRGVYLEGGYAYVSRTKILSIVEGKFRTSLSKNLAHAYQMQFKWSSDTRIGSIVNRLSKVAFQYGGSTGKAIGGGNGTLNSHAVSQIFVDYLTSVMGHSDPKMKPAGVNKMFVSIGTRKPNTADKTCPIVNRVHKSNTQKYTIFFDTLVMEQSCWDGCCQATNKHVYYQIRDNGRCVKVGWNPPPLDTNMIANAVSGLGNGGSSTLDNAATTQMAKKMKLSGTSTSMQVSP